MSDSHSDPLQHMTMACALDKHGRNITDAFDADQQNICCLSYWRTPVGNLYRVDTREIGSYHTVEMLLPTGWTAVFSSRSAKTSAELLRTWLNIQAQDLDPTH